MKNSLKYQTGNIYIYSLSDPDTGEIRYIGKTKHPHSRLRCHLLTSRKQKTGKEKWINNLLQSNQEPVFDIVEVCNPGNWEERERYWIQFYRSQLTNIADGGHGPKPKAPLMAGSGVTKKETIPSQRIPGGTRISKTIEFFPIAKMPMPENLETIRKNAKIIIYWIDEIQVVK